MTCSYLKQSCVGSLNVEVAEQQKRNSVNAQDLQDGY